MVPINFPFTSNNRILELSLSTISNCVSKGIILETWAIRLSGVVSSLMYSNAEYNSDILIFRSLVWELTDIITGASLVSLGVLQLPKKILKHIVLKVVK